MQTIRRMSLLTVVVLVPIARAAEADIAKLVDQLRSGATQTQASLALIDVGLPAMKSLIDAACDKDGVLATWSRDTLRRLVLRARDQGGAAYDRGRIVEVLIDVVKNDRRPPAREAAVQMLGLIGRDEAVPVLVGALGDDALRPHAIASLQQVPGRSASEALASFARTATRVEDRISALHSLGWRGCTISVAALLEATKAQEVNVQLAAVKALGQAGDLSAWSTVQSLAERGADPIKPAAMDACLRLAEVAVREGKRDQAVAVYDKIMRLAKDPPNRMAAIAGFARVAGKAGTSRMIALMGKIGPEADRQIIAELTRMPGPEVTRTLAESSKKAPSDLRVKLLIILGMRRDPHGFSTLLDAYKDTDEKVAAAAVEAMCHTDQPGMDAAIFEALTKGRPLVKAAAVKAGLVVAQRLARQDRAKNEAKILTICRDAMTGSADDASRIEVLRSMADLLGKASLPEIEKVLTAGPGPLRDAAVEAYLSVADTLDAKTDGPQTLAIYNRIIDMGAVPVGRMGAVIERLKALGDTSDIPGRLGVITQWWVVGPWPSPDWSAFDKVFFPEQEIDLGKTYKEGDKEMKWKPVGTPDPTGRVNLKAAIAEADNVAGYAYAEVTSETDQDVVFRTGSDDGMKLWVNGTPVFAKNEPRSLAVDMDTVPAHLNKGVNKVLVKVLNGGGAWEFCARVTTPDGKPVRLQVRPAK